nr:MAG TPA: hypothetical protein [Caudoviricetes sp.]
MKRIANSSKLWYYKEHEKIKSCNSRILSCGD